MVHRNNLSINVKKTVVMHFGLNLERISYFLNNFELEVVSSVKDLDFLIDVFTKSKILKRLL